MIFLKAQLKRIHKVHYYVLQALMNLSNLFGPYLSHGI